MPVKDDFLVRQCMTVSHRIHSPGHKQHRLVLLLRNSLARVLMGRPHTASHTQREILKLLWMGGLRSLLRLSITSSHAPTGNLTFVSPPPVPPRCFAYLSRPPAPALALALPRMKVVDRRRHSDQTRFAPQAHGRPSTELNHARRCEAGANCIRLLLCFLPDLSLLLRLFRSQSSGLLLVFLALLLPSHPLLLRWLTDTKWAFKHHEGPAIF